MPASGRTPGAGVVSATPERPAPRETYDVAVIGGGLLGAAVAERLRSVAPQASVVLIEADGLPNESGATVASPGLIPPLPSGLEAAGASAASPRPAARRWARGWLGEVLAGSPAADAAEAGWLALMAPDAPMPGAAPLDRLVDATVLRAVTALTGVEPDHPARLAVGGYASAEAVTLALARRAVARGADLLLNARARPRTSTQFVIERLAADRRMQVRVRARQPLAARAVVVACGAEAGAVAEAGLDRPVRLRSAYVQFPRVRLSADETLTGGRPLPAIGMAGWTWRPVPAGAFLVPPAPAADPEGYRPAGGRLLGVPVGLRRELIEALLDAPTLGPLLASGRLDVGKSARNVRGARFSIPEGGAPVAKPLGEDWWLLVGGAGGLLDDLVAAATVAAALSGTPLPWPA